MIPKIHKRGRSFKDAVYYIMHDPQADTRDRVAFTCGFNIGEVAPEDAWRNMVHTWEERTRLKREAGVDLRGRDNTKPVFHFTLSWEPGDNPTHEHMQETTRRALEALKLGDHQAVMAVHNDKDHLHLHVIVNTVHPETGRTAPLKFSKQAFQEFRKEYEQEMRQARQELAETERQKFREQRERERQALAPVLRRRAIIRAARALDRSLRPWRPKPLKRDASEKTLRVARLRTELRHFHIVQRGILIGWHRQDRQELHRQLVEERRGAARQAVDYVRTRFKSRWRDLYDAQREENGHLIKIQSNPLERAAYVIRNSERLGNGFPLSAKAKAELIASPTKLFAAVNTMHSRERNALSQIQKVEIATRLARIPDHYQARMSALREKQHAERLDLRSKQRAIRLETDFKDMARDQLIAERWEGAPRRASIRGSRDERDFEYVTRINDEIRALYDRNADPITRAMIAADEPQPTPPVAKEFRMHAEPAPHQRSRMEQIKEAAARWRETHPDIDFDREL